MNYKILFVLLIVSLLISSIAVYSFFQEKKEHRETFNKLDVCITQKQILLAGIDMELAKKGLGR